MSRWQRFLYGNLVSNFTGVLIMDESQHNRRKTDTVTEEQIKAKANNGRNTRELIAENTLLNALAHKDIQREQEKQGVTITFHDRIIWFGIKLIITAGGGGLIALGFWVVKYKIIGG